MKRTDRSNVETPAGHLVYINNPPTPPYIDVSILELNLREYEFFRFYDVLGHLTDVEAKIAYTKNLKKEKTIKMFKAYYNLLIKLFTHPLYESTAVKQMNLLIDHLPTIVNVEDENSFYTKYQEVERSDQNKLDSFLEHMPILIEEIKKNNAATFVGTIQTTEEMNRVSEKIMLCEEQAEYNCMDSNNINYKLLNRLYKNCHRYKGIQMLESNPSKALLYECLYDIDRLISEDPSGGKKRSLSMKERDVARITKALETTFPLAGGYIDCAKMQELWSKVADREYGVAVMEGARRAAADGQQGGAAGVDAELREALGDDAAELRASLRDDVEPEHGERVDDEGHQTLGKEGRNARTPDAARHLRRREKKARRDIGRREERALPEISG